MPGLVLNRNIVDPNGISILNKEYLNDPMVINIMKLISSEYVAIDYEAGPWSIVCSESPTGKLFKNSLDQMIDYMYYIRAKFPNKKFGWYNLPYQKYWDRDQDWRYQMYSLKPLFDVCDVIFPSVYDFYKDNIEINASGDQSYVKDNVKLALEIANGKPVYPFIAYRYHDSNPTYGFGPIPLNEWKSHVAATLIPSYRGKKIEGIWWWGSMQYQYESVLLNNYGTSDMDNKVRTILGQEIEAATLPGQKYLEQLHSKYLKALQETINDTN
jgi:hypothetical protein